MQMISANVLGGSAGVHSGESNQMLPKSRMQYVSEGIVPSF